MISEALSRLGITSIWVGIVYLAIAGWLIYSFWQCYQASRRPDKINAFIFQSIPGIFTTLGVLGTFVGITVALIGFQTDQIEGSIITLLDGMKGAFFSSIIGISLSLVFSWIVKYYMHTYGQHFPVPESEETSLLRQLLKVQTEVKEEMASTRKTFIDTNSESTKKMMGEIQSTNKELVEMGKQAREDTERMIKVLNDNHTLMRDKFDEFAELLSDANTEALREAMEKLITDFNATFQSLIENLVTQNFEELNNSVQSLNAWQQEHRAEVDRLHGYLQVVIGKLNEVANLLGSTYDGMERSFGNSAVSLEQITHHTNALVDDNSRLSQIVRALQNVLVEENRLTQAFDHAVAAMENLLEASEEFEEVKREVTQWLNREKGISSAMTLFNAGMGELNNKLSELESIKTEELKLLDNSFDKRIGAALNTSFGHLDKLIKEYVQFMERNRKIEITLSEKANGQV